MVPSHRGRAALRKGPFHRARAGNPRHSGHPAPHLFHRIPEGGYRIHAPHPGFACREFLRETARPLPRAGDPVTLLLLFLPHRALRIHHHPRAIHRRDPYRRRKARGRHPGVRGEARRVRQAHGALPLLPCLSPAPRLARRLLLPHVEAPQRPRQLVFARLRRPPRADVRTRPCRPHLLRAHPPAHHRLHRPRRTRMGRHPPLQDHRGHQGHRL